MWAIDQAWCVSTEIDAASTLVGGSTELIAELLELPIMEALPISPDAAYITDINRYSIAPCGA
jgi:hypothetical protein